MFFKASQRKMPNHRVNSDWLTRRSSFLAALACDQLICDVRAPSEAWRILQGASPCRVRINHPPVLSAIGDWIWSSYRAMVGKAEAPDWFESDWLLACFGRQRAEAVAGYTDFVRTGIGLPSIWKDLRGQIYLGSDHFVETIRKGTDVGNRGDLSEISRLQRRPWAKPLSWYAETISDRKLAMVKAWLSGDYTMKEISESFGVHYSTVSRAIKAFEANA